MDFITKLLSYFVEIIYYMNMLFSAEYILHASWVIYI